MEALRVLELVLVLLVSTAVKPLDGEVARVSVYQPPDGKEVGGERACGGRLTWDQEHVAVRAWRRRGCGRGVLVWSQETGKAVFTRVMDAGPWGIIPDSGVDVAGRKRVDGKWSKPIWRCYTRSLRPPPGWKWRGGVDLSYRLWVRLGRPRFLSRVVLLYLPREQRQNLSFPSV